MAGEEVVELFTIIVYTGVVVLWFVCHVIEINKRDKEL